jgi:hypothetical protein
MIASIRCLRPSASHSSNKSNPRRQIKLADFEDAFRIDPRFGAQSQYFFIARTLALLHQPCPYPPRQWKEPEDGFRHEMNRSRQIVPAPHVTQLMRKNRFQLRRG